MLETAFPSNDWQEVFNSFKSTSVYLQLSTFIEEEYSAGTVFPPADQIFSAFKLTPLSQVQVLILGQDPYHGPGQAHGLAFSVKSPCKPPPSLKNIFKELKTEPECGDLTSWAEQGVFLLNTVLTVRQGQANSHKSKGWERFTDTVISALSEKKEKMIFVLWGGPAQKKKSLIDSDKHIILESPHPSPLSAYRGFFGCGHFSKINELLREWGRKEIDWNLNSSEPLQLELF